MWMICFERDLTWNESKETEPGSRRARECRERRSSAKEEGWVWIDHVNKEEEKVLGSWVNPEYAAKRER